MLANDDNFFDRTCPHVILLFAKEQADELQPIAQTTPCIVHFASTVMEAIGHYLRLVRVRIVPRAVVAEFSVHSTDRHQRADESGFRLTRNTLYLFEQCFYLDTKIDGQQNGWFVIYTAEAEKAAEALAAYPEPCGSVAIRDMGEVPTEMLFQEIMTL